MIYFYVYLLVAISFWIFLFVQACSLYPMVKNAEDLKITAVVALLWPLLILLAMLAILVAIGSHSLQRFARKAKKTVARFGGGEVGE